MTSQDIIQTLGELADPKQAINLRRFFKTGPGDYGEGDKFLGIKVPTQRQVAKQFLHLPFEEVVKLLSSEYHEHRMTALLILTYMYDQADVEEKADIFDLYMNHTQYINNWDLVDVTAPKIIGDFLLEKPRDILYRLCRSECLWERRISIVSTHRFIKAGQFYDTLEISQHLLHDDHDLIHKAVGWMLREVGKQHEPALLGFLDRHYLTMPRTMLRYAIERLEENRRQLFLYG